LKVKIYPITVYPLQFNTAGAGGAGGGYCDITEKIPPTVVKCIFAEFIKASKNIDESLLGTTGNGVHAPGDKTIADIVDIFWTVPIAGIIGGGKFDNCAPTQYPIIAGPTTSKNVNVVDNCVCTNNAVKVDSIKTVLPNASGTLFKESKPLFMAISYDVVNNFENPAILLPYTFDCMTGNNVDLKIFQDIMFYLNNY
jgi:hypothetical protein